MPSARVRRRAFSLVELAVVLAIFAVLSTIAVPRYGRSLDRYRLDHAARKLAADLNYARRQALHDSRAKSVTVDVAGGTYTVIGVEGFSNQPGPYVVALGDHPYRCGIVSVDFDDPDDADDALSTVVYNGFGVPDSGGNVVIGIGTETRTIDVDADTGEAVVR